MRWPKYFSQYLQPKWITGVYALMIYQGGCPTKAFFTVLASWMVSLQCLSFHVTLDRTCSSVIFFSQYLHLNGFSLSFKLYRTLLTTFALERLLPNVHPLLDFKVEATASRALERVNIVLWDRPKCGSKSHGYITQMWIHYRVCIHILRPRLRFWDQKMWTKINPGTWWNATTFQNIPVRWSAFQR